MQLYRNGVEGWVNREHIKTQPYQHLVSSL